MKTGLRSRGFRAGCLLIVCLALCGAALAQRRNIPPANGKLSAVENQWWETIRQTGAEAAKALEQKDRVIQERRRNTTNIPDDEDLLLSTKEREKLNTALTTTTEKYLAALRLGKEQGYQVPLADSKHPLFLGLIKAHHNKEARLAKVSGAVVLDIVFQNDGTISIARVIRGLGHGLDERASEAARKIVFLPAIKEGSFVTTNGVAEFTFEVY